MNDVGDLYLDFHRVLDSPWLSLQVGRFEIPVGEGYLRRGEGRRESPFITDPVGVPWYWDEGLRLYGGSEDGLFGYVASVSDGETPFNYDEGSGLQTTLKIFTNPHLSLSSLESRGCTNQGIWTQFIELCLHLRIIQDFTRRRSAQVRPSMPGNNAGAYGTDGFRWAGIFSRLLHRAFAFAYAPRRPD